MAVASLKKGLKANLSPSVDGALYFTTDTGELYLYDNSTSIKISDFETVATMNDLPSIGSELANKFYYVSANNGLYRVINNDWAQIGATAPSVNAGTGLAISGSTINHSNSITSGTASGTATGTTLTYAGTFDLPTVTYDAQGHVTAKGTTTLTMPSVSSDATSVSQTVAATPYLVNYLAGEKLTFTIATSNWSSSTVTINGTAYYYYYKQVTDILVSHPLMFLATDSLPTSAQEGAWGGVNMVADVTNKYLRFYAASVPSVNLPVGVRGVVG